MQEWLYPMAVVLLGYTVLGLTGFGSALVVVPLLGIVTVTIEAGKVDRCRHPSPFTTAIVFQTPSSVARCAGISDFS